MYDHVSQTIISNTEDISYNLLNYSPQIKSLGDILYFTVFCINITVEVAAVAYTSVCDVLRMSVVLLTFSYTSLILIMLS